MKKVLVTGGTGFLGKHLLKAVNNNFNVVTLVRNTPIDENSVVIGNFTADTDFSQALGDVNIVIHLAARAHIAKEQLTKPIEEFREVNTYATLQLAKQAYLSGVKRFIFVSSIGVNGVSNSVCFKHSDRPEPTEDYAVSKYEAEIGLKKIAEETGMEVVIIRPPLVYGPNAPGNFGKLAKLASKNLPLPFGAVKNLRSLVAVDNLVDLIITCIDHPKAANQTFLVSDDHDVSTSELLHTMTLAAGKKPRLLPIPMSWLYLVGKLTGKKAIIDRLCGSLRVDISHTKEMLDWKPSVSFNDGIQKCFDKE